MTKTKSNKVKAVKVVESKRMNSERELSTEMPVECVDVEGGERVEAGTGRDARFDTEIKKLRRSWPEWWGFLVQASAGEQAKRGWARSAVSG